MGDIRKTNNKLVPVSQLVDGVLDEIKQKAEYQEIAARKYQELKGKLK